MSWLYLTIPYTWDCGRRICFSAFS